VMYLKVGQDSLTFSGEFANDYSRICKISISLKG